MTGAYAGGEGGAPPAGRSLRLAHRGDHRRASENTVAAIEAALALPGIDGVEFDVRRSADGVAILLHDATLSRVQRRPEAASDVPATELARLGVPTLAAALAVAPAPAFLDIELKADVAEEVVEAVRSARGERPDAVALSSFDAGVLEHLAALVPGWPRWLNAERLDGEAVSTAVRLGCTAISAGWRSIDGGTMAAARSAGLRVAAWTVTSPVDAERLAGLGVVALCVEGPALGADPPARAP